jgi:hypothetical protein
MRVDALNQLSDAQAFAATAVSTNTFDSGSAGNDISIGEELALAVAVDVAADFTTGDETYELQLIQSAAADLSSPDVLASRPILASALTVGSTHYLPMPQGSKSKQYLGAKMVLAGTTPSVTLTIFLQPASMLDKQKNYPNNYVVA